MASPLRSLTERQLVAARESEIAALPEFLERHPEIGNEFPAITQPFEDAINSVHSIGGYDSTDTAPLLAHQAIREIYYAFGDQRSDNKRLSMFAEEILKLLDITDETSIAAFPASIAGKTGLAGCPRAEPTFDLALRCLRRKRAGGHPSISVYHDTSGTPLALRKKYDESSALTLVPLEIEGSTSVPAGTIIELSDDMNANRTGDRPFNNIRLRTFQIDDELEICPIRLSPWIHATRSARALFSGKYYPNNPKRYTFIYDGDRRKVVTGNSIEDFEKAATKIIALCDPS